MDEGHAVEDRALVERIGSEEAVELSSRRLATISGRRHGADLYIGIGIKAVLREIVAQQILWIEKSRAPRT